MASIRLRSPIMGPEELALIARQQAMLAEIATQLEKGLPLSRQESGLAAAVLRAYAGQMRPARAPEGAPPRARIEDIDAVISALHEVPPRHGRGAILEKHAKDLNVSPEWLRRKVSARRAELHALWKALASVR